MTRTYTLIQTEITPTYAGMLISIIAIDNDTIGDTFGVALSVSLILLCGSIAIAISETFFLQYCNRLS